MRRAGWSPSPGWTFLVHHNLKMSLRQLKRNGTYSAINIAGLGIGLATCILLLLYAKDEIEYDSFHEQKDKIFQLIVDRRESEGSGKTFAIAGMIQGPAFKNEIPEIDDFVRVRGQQLTIKKEATVLSESVTWVDPSFFSIFSFPLISGDPASSLSAIQSVVITKSVAEKYFNTTDAIGKSLEIEVNGAFVNFTVSAVAYDYPENSSIKFGILLPFGFLDRYSPDNGWHWVNFPTYFTLHHGADLKSVRRKMAAVYKTQASQEIDEMELLGYGDKFTWSLHPFTDMHLNTSYEGTPGASDPIYAYVLLSIALFILVIATINFVNLSIAQSIKRGKEIGIRKTIGGQRAQLIRQFLTETWMLCLFAFSLGLMLAFLSLPFFNTLANKHMSLAYLLDARLITGLGTLFLITTLVSGAYPAFILSGFAPIQSLSNRVTISGKNNLGKTLIVVQFALASFLIISTFFFHAQFNLLTHKDIGYNDRDVVEVTVAKAIMDRQLSRLLKSEFSAVKGVEVVATHNIGRFGGPSKANGREIVAVYERVDEDFLPSLQIPMVAGRNFSADFPGDSIHSLLVNESFVQAAGWKDAVGKTIDFMNIPGWGDKKLTIVGVVKDHHFESLRERIKPEIFTYEPKLPLGRFIIRISEHDIAKTLDGVEASMKKVLPNDPFQYVFLEDSKLKNYEQEARWKKIITVAAGLTVFISCIGLIGLTALSTERRSKEIGIRKILGSSTAQIIRLIGKEFVALTLLGFCLALPLVWITMTRWLDTFAYRVPLDISTFAAAGLLVVFVAAMSITIQTYRTSSANPIQSLKRD